MIRFALVVLVSAVGFRLVQERINYPYMDEIFHVPQAQRYCRGDFTWDQKITTPPGIYIISLAIRHLTGRCDLFMLRAINFGALIGGSYASAAVLARPDLAPVIASLPILGFYANIYYTDVWSTVLVLIGLGLTLRNYHFAASAILGLSLLFRQTNIVWAGFAGVLALMDANTFSYSLSECPKSQTRAAMGNVFRPAVWTPYVLIAVGFSIFVLQNGGITLGDKSNHEVSIHIAQVLYFALFGALFTVPLAVRSGWAGRYLSRLRQIHRPAALIRYSVEAGVIAAVIRYFTIVHPFIIADNRHYTFYLWRRVLHRPEHPILAYAMVPVYHAALDWMIWAPRKANLTVIMFWIGVAAVLIPSPLMEPRYYALPLLIWRTILVPNQRVVQEIAYSLVILIATVLIFATSKNHFMW